MTCIGVNFNNSRFVISVARADHLPVADRPEIALIGRSNVGKSSLINALLSCRTIAKTSKTPGRTRQLNFFDVDQQFFLVDLPGYGYAKAPKSEIKHWTNLTLNYLTNRSNLGRIFLLVDARHGLKTNDIEMMRLFDNHALPYQIILTKIDSTSANEISNKVKIIQDLYFKHPALLHKITNVSSRKKIGITNVRDDIINLLAKM